MSPDSKAHGAIMGPMWGRQNPGGPQLGPMNFAIWVVRKMAAIHTSLVYVIIDLDNSV